MSEKTGTLVPELVDKIQALRQLAGAEGIRLKITSARRGFSKQAAMWNAYRRSPAEALERFGVTSAPAPMGRTRHHGYFDGKAAAVDMAVTSYPDAFVDKIAAQDRLGALGKSIGLLWGGDWRRKDRVHFELLKDGQRFDVSAQYELLGGKLDRLAGILEGEG